jgi:hypothetical protein
MYAARIEDEKITKILPPFPQPLDEFLQDPAVPHIHTLQRFCVLVLAQFKGVL